MAVDALDIITPAEFGVAINVEPEDPLTLAEREQTVTAASRIVDQVFGPIVAREVEDETHDGGRPRIRPKQTPIVEVTEVTEYASTAPTTLEPEDNETKPTYGYLVKGDGHDVALWRRSGGGASLWAYGDSNIVISYTAGRYEDTESVDRRFKEACITVAIHLWQTKGGAPGSASGDGAPYGGVPYSMKVLKQRLIESLPDDARPPVVG